MKKIGKAMIGMLIAREWAQFSIGVALCAQGVKYTQVEKGAAVSTEMWPWLKVIAPIDLALIRAGYKVRESVDF